MAAYEFYPLSLHDALPISLVPEAELDRYATTLHSITHGRGTYRAKFHVYQEVPPDAELRAVRAAPVRDRVQDRKSTRLNSSHGYISYAVFCLKKKNIKKTQIFFSMLFLCTFFSFGC